MLQLFLLFIAAQLLQFFLGRKQMQKFNQLFYELRSKGNVLVGKDKGRLKSGSILVFQLDETVIKEAFYLKGRSVFAKPQRLENEIGKNIHQLAFDNHSLQRSYENALTNL
jgi:DNA-binding transcriptional regulator of glucitol operon